MIGAARTATNPTRWSLLSSPARPPRVSRARVRLAWIDPRSRSARDEPPLRTLLRNMRRPFPRSGLAALALGSTALLGAAVVASLPTEVQQPGTQPQEVAPLNTSSNCYLCHGN